MSVEEFFELFLEELQHSPELTEYYKFLHDSERVAFRKAYFAERLRYIHQHVGRRDRVWDCGCGYATTAIFLALNGISTFGNTLEFYYAHIPKRMEYWSKFGDMSRINVAYENHFDLDLTPGSFDVVIAQDTLHHLEPLAEALTVIYKALAPGGRLIAIEENGNNIFQTVKLYRQRGNKRIIKLHDERLGKTILLGNENIRPFSVWRSELEKVGFDMLNPELQHVRYYLPQFTRRFEEPEHLVAAEQAIQTQWKKEYFFFGLNFLARKRN